MDDSDFVGVGGLEERVRGGSLFTSGLDGSVVLLKDFSLLVLPTCIPPSGTSTLASGLASDFTSAGAASGAGALGEGVNCGLFADPNPGLANPDWGLEPGFWIPEPGFGSPEGVGLEASPRGDCVGEEPFPLRGMPPSFGTPPGLDERAPGSSSRLLDLLEGRAGVCSTA